MSDVQTKPDAAQQLLCLRDKLLNDTDFVRVIDAVSDGKSASLDGVVGSSCALVAAAMAERSDPAPRLGCLSSLVRDRRLGR